jgi:hypothetical protein
MLYYVYELRDDGDNKLLGTIDAPSYDAAKHRAHKKWNPMDLLTLAVKSQPDPVKNEGPSSQEQRAKIVDKVRKLLALSTSPNENEAASAAEKAQALLAEYNLSVEEIKQDGSRVEDIFITKARLRTPSVPWIRYIGGACAALYFCKYYYTHDYVYTAQRKCGYIRKDIHSFVGAEHNIAVADMMFEYLIKTVDRLSKEGQKSVHPRERTSYDTSFKQACSLRLASRIKERIEAAKQGKVKSETTGKNLPALLNVYERTEKALKEHLDKTVKLRKSRKQPIASNSRGVADGRRAGDSIGLDPQVGNSGPAGLLS